MPGLDRHTTAFRFSQFLGRSTTGPVAGCRHVLLFRLFVEEKQNSMEWICWVQTAVEFPRWFLRSVVLLTKIRKSNRLVGSFLRVC